MNCILIILQKYKYFSIKKTFAAETGVPVAAANGMI